MSSFGSSGSSLPPNGLPRNLSFDYVRPEEVRAAHALEVEGYPVEDAASYEKLLSRQKAAPHLFLGAFIPLPPPKVAGPLSVSGPARRKLVGFITGTAATALTLRSMSTHDTSEDAHLVCIHSVCVSPDYQRKGLATRMLENYIARIRRAEEGKGPDGEKGKRGYETLALLAHEELTALYKKVGFRVQCHSHVQYGSGQWLEMRRPVSAPVNGPVLSRTSSNKSSSSDGFVSSPGSMAPLTPDNNVVPISIGSSDKAPESPAVESSGSPALSTASSKAATPKVNDRSPPPESTPLSSDTTPKPVATPAPARAPATISEAKATPPAPAQSPPGMPSQASILAALAAQSQPGQNPGVTYTSLLGQAVAAKTAAEDAGMALEARLVDRDTGSNLAKLYCPMENCRCCILGKGAGEWTRKESGPLSNPALELANSPKPPQGPAFPVQGVASKASHRLLTSVKGFWLVDGPLQFGNIGFSRDMKWTAPLPESPQSPKSTESGTYFPAGPRSKAYEKEAKAREKREEKERKKEAKLKEKRDRAKEKRGSSGSDSNTEEDDIASLLAHLSLGITPGEEVTVKYLLCPDCECGPLGFTILPQDMQNGRLAAQVGEDVDRMKGGLHDSSTGDAPPKRKPQPFYLAAERVRYHFERK